MSHFIVKVNDQLFKMKDTDFRYNNPSFGYVSISKLKSEVLDKFTHINSRKVIIQAGENNIKYMIFGDASVLEYDGE